MARTQAGDRFFGADASDFSVGVFKELTELRHHDRRSLGQLRQTQSSTSAEEQYRFFLFL